jgi:hypothetical protein
MSTTSVSFVNCSDLYMTSVDSALVHHLFVISFCGFNCMSAKLIPVTIHILNSKFVIYWQCHLLRLYGIGAKLMNEYGVLVEWYWQGRSKVLKRKTYDSATLSITDVTWTGLELNRGLHSERLVTSYLSLGKAHKLCQGHWEYHILCWCTYYKTWP